MKNNTSLERTKTKKLLCHQNIVAGNHCHLDFFFIAPVRRTTVKQYHYMNEKYNLNWLSSKKTDSFVRLSGCQDENCCCT